MDRKSDTTRFFGKKNMRGVAITLLIAASFFIPTPYILYQPGSAEVLAPKVTVKEGNKDEKGNLMLVTVLSIKASNIYYLGYGWVAPHTEIRKEEEVKQGMSDTEYSRLLKHMMDSSQQNATYNGLHAADKEVKVENEGVFVRIVLPNSKAKGILEVGDIITAADDKPIHKSEDLIDYLNENKKPGEKVRLSYLRDGKEHTGEIELVELGAENQTEPGVPKKVGIGVYPENEIKLDTPYDVQIHAEDIGGPSAGLMFSLEIYSQLTQGDLTQGHKIAGTGTINLEGEVGQIGGIRHKIVAAHDKGAEIFFAPADVQENDANAHDAADEVKKLGYDMKVVPVKTLQDAIDYLKKLPPKS